MPGSNALTGGGDVPGLELKAWALFNGVSGALIKGSNVSGVVRTAGGTYQVTMQSAMPSTNAVVKCLPDKSGAGSFLPVHVYGTVISTSQVNVSAISHNTSTNGTAAFDPPMVYVGVYG